MKLRQLIVSLAALLIGVLFTAPFVRAQTCDGITQANCTGACEWASNISPPRCSPRPCGNRTQSFCSGTCSWNSQTTPPRCESDPTGGYTGSFSEFAQGFIGVIGLNQNLTTIPGIINTLVPIIITFAGLILFVMLIAGGFQMLTSASNPEAAKAGQGRITTALIGFLIIFAAYWIVQIVEIVLGINIFGN